MSEELRLCERPALRSTWRDGDLVWLGLLLAACSAALMVALAWWLLG